MDEIEEIRERVASLEERVSELEALTEDDPEVIGETPSLKGFIQKHDPQNHPETALVIGFYIEKYDGQDDGFTTSDVREGYQRCRLSLPENLSDALNKCANNNWMASYEKDGQERIRHVTPEGEAYVEEMIENGA